MILEQIEGERQIKKINGGVAIQWVNKKLFTLPWDPFKFIYKIELI